MRIKQKTIDECVALDMDEGYYTDMFELDTQIVASSAIFPTLAEQLPWEAFATYTENLNL